MLEYTYDLKTNLKSLSKCPLKAYLRSYNYTLPFPRKYFFLISDEWLMYDDDRVTPVLAEDVLKLSGGGNAQFPLLLIETSYMRVCV